MEDESFMRGYIAIKEIGRGAYGILYEAIRELNNKKVAVKVVKKENISIQSKVVESIKNECKLMMCLNHPNILKVYETQEDEKNYYCAMELYSTTLHDVLADFSRFGESRSFYIFNQLLGALDYLHMKNIIHRDVKLDNILTNYSYGTNEDVIIALADFGLSVVQEKFGKPIKSYAGTLTYSPPEVFLVSEGIGHQGRPVDVWAASVILYVMITGEYPRKAVDKFELINSIIYDNFKIPKNITISEKTVIFLKWLLNKNPKIRPTIDQIKKNIYFINMLESYNKEKEEKIHKYSNIKNIERTISYSSSIDYNIEGIERTISYKSSSEF